MATFRFYVGRQGETSVACDAEVPSREEIATFKGGKIKVKTPVGPREVLVSSALQLILASLTVELQNGVRDEIFPPKPAENGKKGGKRSTGYLDRVERPDLEKHGV